MIGLWLDVDSRDEAGNDIRQLIIRVVSVTISQSQGGQRRSSINAKGGLPAPNTPLDNLRSPCFPGVRYLRVSATWPMTPMLSSALAPPGWRTMQNQIRTGRRDGALPMFFRQIRRRSLHDAFEYLRGLSRRFSHTRTRHPSHHRMHDYMISPTTQKYTCSILHLNHPMKQNITRHASSLPSVLPPCCSPKPVIPSTARCTYHTSTSSSTDHSLICTVPESSP